MTTTEPLGTAKKKSRIPKILLRILCILIILLIIIGAAVSFYALYTKTHYRITFYQETSKKVSSNIRAAVISDIHVREYGENNETLISDLRALKPDLILFLGDMVIRDQDDYQPALDLVAASQRSHLVMASWETTRANVSITVTTKDLPMHLKRRD